MNRFLYVLVLFLSCVGCASLSPQTRSFLDSNPNPRSAHLSEVPFNEQAEGDCGPASLASVMNFSGTKIQQSELRSEVYNSEKKGTLPISLIAAIRNHGLMGVPVQNLKSLTEEIANGKPVLILQNLGLSWLPKWHYAVVTGYNIDRQEVLLHSGTDQNLRMPMTRFERYWSLADNWGIVVFPPNQLSPTANEVEHMKAASGLEAAGKVAEAELAYLEILKRWPESSLAYIGLGNISFNKGNYLSAVQYLTKAQKIDPESKVIANNLGVAEQMLTKPKKRVN